MFQHIPIVHTHRRSMRAATNEGGINSIGCGEAAWQTFFGLLRVKYIGGLIETFGHTRSPLASPPIVVLLNTRITGLEVGGSPLNFVETSALAEIKPLWKYIAFAFASLDRGAVYQHFRFLFIVASNEKKCKSVVDEQFRSKLEERKFNRGRGSVPF